MCLMVQVFTASASGFLESMENEDTQHNDLFLALATIHLQRVPGDILVAGSGEKSRSVN